MNSVAGTADELLRETHLFSVLPEFGSRCWAVVTQLPIRGWQLTFLVQQMTGRHKA